MGVSCRYKLVRLVKFPISSGTNPERSVSERDNSDNRVNKPISVGTVPLISSLLIQRRSRSVKRPILVEIDPMSLLPEPKRSVSLVSCPISEQTTPDTPDRPKLSLFSSVRPYSSLGIDPAILVDEMSNSSKFDINPTSVGIIPDMKGQSSMTNSFRLDNRPNSDGIVPSTESDDNTNTSNLASKPSSEGSEPSIGESTILRYRSRDNLPNSGGIVPLMLAPSNVNSSKFVNWPISNGSSPSRPPETDKPPSRRVSRCTAWPISLGIVPVIKFHARSRILSFDTFQTSDGRRPER
mmetsp:Transcript_10471/g.24260  ORF Transcript_10471/g.24260 Transcript_10471/m.24260 type:complete len:295 (-) Transcript_10471:134-1018(-)